jgi:hypothetical protein
MTFLEVHAEQKVYRWEIEGMPKGKGETGYKERVAYLNAYLQKYSEVMAFALEGAKIYIVHESKMHTNGTQKIHRRASAGG